MYFTNILVVSLAVFLGLVTAQTTTEPVTGIQGNATVVENNPPGIVYTATLPEKEFNNPADPRGNIKGSIAAVAASNGIGVEFKVSFSNLPTSGGPFLYHIHAAPVNTEGNCTSTLAHLDPFIRGEAPACDPKLPQTCQVGDLSGKYGKITSDPFTASYKDEFASTLPGIGAFFGNRSITIHFANKTRITCANFTLTGTSGFNGTGTGNGNLSSTATLSPTSSASVTQNSAPVTQTSPPLTFTGLAAIEKAQMTLVLLMGAMGVAFLL